MLTTKEHAAEALLGMTRADRDVADGELLQASNQAWHAAKHAVNAAAVSRSRNAVQYAAKRRFVQELAAESGNYRLEDWLAYTWRLHGNADQGFMPPAKVAEGVATTRLLVDRLLEIAGHQ